MKKLIVLLIAWILMPVIVSAITVTWDPVTTNEDGTECTDLKQYNIYMNDSLSGTVDAPGVEWGVSLEDGTYSFYVTAEDTSGNESGPSNTITHTVATKPSAPKGCRIK